MIFKPGKEWPQIVDLNVCDIKDTVGGYVDIHEMRRAGRDLFVITRAGAEAAGELPNRIIDGRLLYGTIVVCSKGLAPLSMYVARDLRDDCEWPMAQLEVAEIG